MIAIIRVNSDHIYTLLNAILWAPKVKKVERRTCRKIWETVYHKTVFTWAKNLFRSRFTNGWKVVSFFKVIQYTCIYRCRRESCDGQISASYCKIIPAFQVISKTVVVHRKEQYNLNNWPALLLGLWKIKNMRPHQQWFQPFAQTGFISRKLKNFLQSLIILNGDLWPFIFPTDKCKNKN